MFPVYFSLIPLSVLDSSKMSSFCSFPCQPVLILCADLIVTVVLFLAPTQTHAVLHLRCLCNSSQGQYLSRPVMPCTEVDSYLIKKVTGDCSLKGLML